MLSPIEGREYKLLLDAGAFPGAPSDKTAKGFWKRRLKPLIDKTLDAKGDGATRAEGELRLKKKRIVVFLDTNKNLLARHGFALRKRTFIEDGRLTGVAEVTLKFRTPDLLLAAAYCEAAKKRDGATTLEEDIAPLQVSRGKKPVAAAKPPSTYSRFSVSTKLLLDDPFKNLGAVFERFPMLKDGLGHDAAKANAALKIHTGPTICEWVYQHALVDLGEDLNAEFGFTLWYFLKGGLTRTRWRQIATGGSDPNVAEISFDFKTKDGRMNAASAGRARTLFIAMEEPKRLPVNLQDTSKTALGRPGGA